MDGTPEEMAKIGDLAAILALTELVRLVLAEVTYSDDRGKFLARLQSLEDRTVSAISGRTFFPGAGDETNFHVREAASAYVTRIFTSIRHPSD